MTQKIDSVKYIDFVKKTTSPASSSLGEFKERVTSLKEQGANVTHLLTAALGMTAEAGEFTEIVKKMFLQGKPYNEDNVFHLKRELGDQLWYVAQACIALGTNFDEIMEMNYEKISERYPEGTFSVYMSENRKDGDI